MATTTRPTLAQVLNAAGRGDVDCVRRWLEGGGDPNITCRETVHTARDTDYYEGETPLMVASMSGRVEVIRILLQAGADVNISRPAESALEEDEGDTESALTLALECRPEAAQLLLDHGADKMTFQRLSPFQTHRCLRDHRILRMFFIAGVDVLALQLNGRNFEELAR